MKAKAYVVGRDPGSDVWLEDNPLGRAEHVDARGCGRDEGLNDGQS